MSLKIIRGMEHFIGSEENGVVTMGTFDGLHLGHQMILKRLIDSSLREKLHPLAITFEPHPRVLVTPDSPPPLLTTWDEKVALFSRYMSGHLLVLEFNRELMNLTAEDFIRKYLVDKIGLKRLIVGYDHAFGKNRSGTINDLMELSHKYSFALEIVDPILVDGKPISSSRIRRAFQEGKFAEGIAMLGHSYSVGGTVIRGIGLGKKLGYPTANLRIGPRKLLPPEGVYACRVEIDGNKYDGMMFIGTNHFNPGAGVSVEVNIFEFERDIYDREIIIYPERFLRENRKFSGPEALAAQIKLDKEQAMSIKK
ncbi:Riboflavin kinase/FMN adenylyltransferase [Candidatus Zixiibacteriota bacterium]|nr:Riboflavin kinase/FMN adenylyltransferase [candidate division Zixibacteria bacterium]